MYILLQEHGLLHVESTDVDCNAVLFVRTPRFEVAVKPSQAECQRSSLSG